MGYTAPTSTYQKLTPKEKEIFDKWQERLKAEGRPVYTDGVISKYMRDIVKRLNYIVSATLPHERKTVLKKVRLEIEQDYLEKKGEFEQFDNALKLVEGVR